MLKFAGLVLMSMSAVLVSSAALADHHDDSRDGRENGGIHMMAPEIDPASTLTAMTLLFGGLTVLRGRRALK